MLLLLKIVVRSHQRGKADPVRTIAQFKYYKRLSVGMLCASIAMRSK